ncbi:MAG: hypothetical protein ACYDC7_01175 [Acidithiobacillus ferrivorans]
MTVDVLDAMDKIGSFCGLLALPYLMFQNLRSRPRIAFEFHGSSGQHIQLDGIHQYRYEVFGVIKNKSLDPNTVSKICLVVWGKKAKTSYLRFGFGGVSVYETSSKQLLSLPIALAPREAKATQIIFEFPVQGTSDEKILSDVIPVVPGSNLLRQRYKYDLCFEDINGNLYEASGDQVNAIEAALRWTLPNTVRQFQDGHIWPFISHYLMILRSKIGFKLRITLQALGLWR